MKKLVFLLLVMLIGFTSYSQVYYKAVITEMYTYNSKTEGWDLEQKNGDVSITVVVEDDFLSIQAKSPSMYKIYGGTKENINTKTLSGYRYQARDLKQDVSVYIDILRGKEDGVGMISIINKGQGYNFRFFVVPFEK